MRKFNQFAEWLVESIIQEAVVRFGAHTGKDAEQVPFKYWLWLADTVVQNQNWTPRIEDENGNLMSRNDVLNFIQERAKVQQRRPAPKKEEPIVKPQEKPKEDWVLAKVLNIQGFKPGEHVIATRSGDGWMVMNRNTETKKVPGNEIETSLKAIRDANNKPLRSSDPETLWKLTGEPEAPEGGNPHILGLEKMHEEVAAIDAAFEKMMHDPKQSHIMIGALAGTGKTTTLKHLAWKYGNNNQKWLYLVFNTKNMVEAKEKFPPWVEVYTTNAFLGYVLGNKENVRKIPQTSRVLKISQNLSKARLIADGGKFQNKLKEDYGIPYKDEINNQTLNDFGINGFKDIKFYSNLLTKLIGRIRGQFQERSLTLLGLLKSFGVNPYKKDNLESEVNKVFDKYDSFKNDKVHEKGYFDTSLEEIKESINGYRDPHTRKTVLRILNHLFGLNFMDKDFKEEIISAATWLLHETLPHGTDQKHITRDNKGREIEHHLGEYRDFDDDLWYPSIFSDNLHWDRYDIVMADEVQDFNENQKIMLKGLHDAGAKIVAVGDKNQALYRFRGADASAFDNLSKMLGDLSYNKDSWKEMSLSNNFRSRRNILDFVNQKTHVKNLKAGKKFKDNDGGTVTDKEIEYKDVFEALGKERKEKGRIKETAFISRTNKPLVHCALKLLGNGVPFVIVGKDVAGDLLKHIKSIMKNVRLTNQDGVFKLADAIVDFEEKEKDAHEFKSTKKHHLEKLRDTTLALMASIDKFTGNEEGKTPQNASIAQFEKWLISKLGGFEIQDDEADLKAFNEKIKKEHPVILTTSHKSKGLEFSRVYILRDDQFKHPRSKHPEEIGQDENSRYVAYTRAMDELHLIKLEGQPGYKGEKEDKN